MLTRAEYNSTPNRMHCPQASVAKVYESVILIEHPVPPPLNKDICTFFQGSELVSLSTSPPRPPRSYKNLFMIQFAETRILSSPCEIQRTASADRVIAYKSPGSTDPIPLHPTIPQNKKQGTKPSSFKRQCHPPVQWRS
jgi:hypothetical protein